MGGTSSAVLAANPDEKLNSGYGYGVNADWSFTISNIPYPVYNLIVYDLGRNVGDVKGITVAGTTYYTSSPNLTGSGYLDNNASTPYIYTVSTSTNQALPTLQSNYVIFSGLSGGSQVVAVQGPLFREINGFQIVSVPEPSRLMLLGVAALLGLRRYRRYLA